MFRCVAAQTLVPTTAEEAAELFGDGDGVTVLAGGTILMPLITAGAVSPARALLLHRAGLDTIEADGGVIRVGAMTTLSAIASGDDPLLARFAREIADAEVRSAATVGGNLCASEGYAVQRGDLAAPLI